LFDRRAWLVLCWIGALVGAVTFSAFVIGRELDGDSAQTMAFATLALAELALVYGMRSTTTATWRLPPNRWLDLSVGVSAAVVAAIVFLPFGHDVFATSGLDVQETVLVTALALVPLTGVELLKALLRRGRLSAASVRP